LRLGRVAETGAAFAAQATEHRGEGPFESPGGRYLFSAKTGAGGTEQLWRRLPSIGEEHQVLPEAFRGNFAMTGERVYRIPQLDAGCDCYHLPWLDVRLACLEVLALGGRRGGDDAAGGGYWIVRAALARAVSEAAAFIAERGVAEEGAPPLVRLVALIAARFSTVVTEEVAAKAVPVVGALAGGAVNLLFMRHFQETARGHFVVKRLEKTYGVDAVRAAYEELST
jgi:hypothetical protein